MTKKQIYLLIGTVVSWSCGYLGADRFYKGDIGLGILKLVTLGGLGVCGSWMPHFGRVT
jgi:TM2 domain-containing membrane protein YozV